MRFIKFCQALLNDLNVSFLFGYYTDENRIGGFETITNGQFGEVSVPVFVDGVECSDHQALSIEQCITNAYVGFIRDQCACEGCSEDLGVRCPGLYTQYIANSYFLVHA